MPEEKKLTRLQQFIKDKPTPEDIIMEWCDDEHKENALGFVAWLRENKITPKASRSSPYLWEAKYKNKTLCTLSVKHAALSQGDWGVGLHLTNMDDYSEVIANEELQEIIWNGTSYCAYGERSPYFGMEKAPGCNPKKRCIPGKTIDDYKIPKQHKKQRKENLFPLPIQKHMIQTLFHTTQVNHSATFHYLINTLYRTAKLPQKSSHYQTI